MSPVSTRRRSRSQSDATELSKASKGSASWSSSRGRRTKRDRAESAGEMSVLSTASSVVPSQESEEGRKDEEPDIHMQKDEVHDVIENMPVAPQKAEPTMNVIVHRVRCLNFQPKAVLAMKATGTWCKHGLLALSRDNGYVELKSSDEKLRTLAFIPGYRKRPVTSLAWIRQSSESNVPILIGATRDGNIFVANFAKQSLTSATASGGGGVFALESLCGIPGCESMVAAGCEDGAVRIFEYHEQGRLTLVSSIASSGAPVLSLACKSQFENSGGLEGLTIFAAIADGTIRRFDSSVRNDKISWTSINRMTVESLGRNIPTRVWAMKCLQDGTLVSANSLGQVQFWDGETGSLSQSIEQTITKADVLDLAVSADESKVFASGVDSRVVCIQRQLGTGNSNWLLSQAQRPHTHDVKSLEICRKFIRSKGGKGVHEVELLVTAGHDTKLCSYNVAKYDKKRPRVIYPWPTFSPVFVASDARTVGIAREDKVDLYRLHPKENALSDTLQIPEDEMPLGTVHVRHTSNISCADMSKDGNFLAVANMASCYIFRMSIDKKQSLQTKQLSVETNMKSSISSLRFLNKTTLLLAGTDGSMAVISLNEVDNESRTIKCTKHKTFDPSLTPTIFPITCVVASSSGQYFATHQNSLEGGIVQIFSIGNGLEICPIWKLPALDAAVTAITFLREDSIAVTTTDFGLFVFDFKQQRLSKWNQDAGTSASLPPELIYRKDFPVRISTLSGNPNKVLVSSFGMFVVFDLERPFPSTCKSYPETHVRVNKRKRSSSTSGTKEKKEQESTAIICLRYNSMLHLGNVDEGELIVVEQPWLNVVANFPPALARRVYGT